MSEWKRAANREHTCGNDLLSSGALSGEYHEVLAGLLKTCHLTTNENNADDSTSILASMRASVSAVFIMASAIPAVERRVLSLDDTTSISRLLLSSAAVFWAEV